MTSPGEMSTCDDDYLFVNRPVQVDPEWLASLSKYTSVEPPLRSGMVEVSLNEYGEGTCEYLDVPSVSVETVEGWRAERFAAYRKARDENPDIPEIEDGWFRYFSYPHAGKFEHVRGWYAVSGSR